MHRTTTTATLLMTVAASALTGCVTVQHHPTAPGASAVPVPAPAVPPLPRPDGKGRARVIQAPAREALEMVAEPAPAPRRRAEPEAEPVPAARGREDAGRQKKVHPRRPAAPHEPAGPRIEIPDVESEVRRKADVCALGRQYGAWREDSPEARICDEAYGR
ncbi:hypothetical protein [Streptomyces sp. 4F14]|uniref:hypothetical protein n=1 Tax=Streptomyces sp. 4F14 TaxID=3394380 RepID=UPI003A8576BC